MLEKIAEIICEQAGLEVNEVEINQNTDFREDLNLDSLSAVEIVMAIEEEFNIEIPDEIAETLTTVGSLSEYILSQK